MKETLVIYHKGCVDGFTAAWACYKGFQDKTPVGFESFDYLPASYGDIPPDVTGKRVFVVDFSYTREQLIAMNEQAESLVVLDHHKSARERLEGLDYCHFDMDRSGASMAWDFFFGGKEDRPWIVNYVQDRDLWRFELPHSREVNAYLQIQEQTFENWDSLNDLISVFRAAEFGSIALKTQKNYVETTASQDAHMVRFAGHIVPCINASYWCGSELLELLAKTPVAPKPGMTWCEALEREGVVQPPFAIGWHVIASGGYVYQLRSRKQSGQAFDVSALAEMHGGGGHREAAGFYASKIVH
jgi:oligoribonuclease NrnB/cAMP/cGMP phosphodiesterase (DHH superfamily)